MVTDKADREGCSPEMTVLEGADGFKTPAGNSGYGEKLKGQAVPVATLAANFRRIGDPVYAQRANRGGFSGSSTQIPRLTMAEKHGIL